MVTFTPNPGDDARAAIITAVHDDGPEGSVNLAVLAPSGGAVSGAQHVRHAITGEGSVWDWPPRV